MFPVISSPRTICPGDQSLRPDKGASNDSAQNWPAALGEALATSRPAAPSKRRKPTRRPVSLRPAMQKRRRDNIPAGIPSQVGIFLGAEGARPETTTARPNSKHHPSADECP